MIWANPRVSLLSYAPWKRWDSRGRGEGVSGGGGGGLRGRVLSGCSNVALSKNS